MIITDTALKNRTTVFVVMLLIIVMGVYAYVSLPREAAPDIQIPYVIVTTTYAGVAPSDIEQNITQEIEKKVTGISDVKEITSNSTEGVSTIVIEFMPSTNIEDALQKVRDKVDEAKPDMPDDIDDPVISEVNFSEFPIMLLNIHGPASLIKLKDIAEDLQDRIEKIDGVLSANISGDLTRQIRVEVDPYRTAAYRIPVSTLFTAIAQENQNVSGGTLDMADAKYSARVEGEFAEPSEIVNLIIAQRNGRPIYLSDVARVRDTFEDRTSVSRFNGSPSVTVSVVKRAGKNVVDIADQVFQVVREESPKLPKGVTIDTTLDNSKTVRRMVGDLENNMLTGLVLVIAVLMFLGLRNASLVAIAIPFSMLLAFAVLFALDITLNMVVLFSLILVVGMLVDNAIVIVENIYRHMQEEGKARFQATRDATSEVAWPVVTSTLTTVAAFLPMLFWPGIVGEFMGFLPKTVIIALLASLFVALVINPTLCSYLVKPRKRDLEPGRHHPFVAAYRVVLTMAVRPWVRSSLLVAGLILLAGSVVAFNKLNGKVEFFPSSDPQLARVNITMPIGTPLEVTDALSRQIEKMIQKYQLNHRTDGKANVQFITANVGSEGVSFGNFGSSGGGTNRAQISVDFVDFEDRPVPAKEVLDELRADISDTVAGAQIQVEEQKRGPPAGKPVQIEISGDEYDRLVPIAEQAKRIVRQIPGVTDIDDDYDAGKPELRIVVDRQRAALLNLSTGTVAQTLKAAVRGIEVSKYREGNDDYDIVVRLPEEYRRRFDHVEALTIAGPSGEPVPLGAVAHIKYTAGLASIKRIDQKRTITITGEVLAGFNARDILTDAQARLTDAIRLPAGYSINFTGEDEEREKAFSFLLVAFIVAVLLIVAVLVTQFNSILLPLVVMSSVLLSLIGVFAGLTITDKAFGLMSFIGAISLAGVVVNNAIVLIDYTEKLRASGMSVYDAVITAGTRRMRPVLLTAITTILGLIPMAVGFNLDLRNLVFNARSESAEWWGPMAVVVIFGLAVATVLTLVVVPAMYMMLEPVRAFFAHHSNRADTGLADE